MFMFIAFVYIYFDNSMILVMYCNYHIFQICIIYKYIHF